MLRNYIKISARNLLRQKVYSSINIFGLAIALAFCILIFLFVRDEMTHDSFHQNADRLYRVNMLSKEDDGSMSFWKNFPKLSIWPGLESGGMSSIIRDNLPERPSPSPIPIFSRCSVFD